MATTDKRKYPTIPIHKVYKKSRLRNCPQGYTLKDFEQTITLSSNETCRTLNLLGEDFLNGFVKNEHTEIHRGLVQVAIKPLSEVGVYAPLIVCIRDDRILGFKRSLLALVQANISSGPFYFNCYPNYPVPVADANSSLALFVNTIGTSMAITVRIVCKSMEGMIQVFPIHCGKPYPDGYTRYINAVSGRRATNKWDDVIQVLPDKDGLSRCPDSVKPFQKYPKIPIEELYKKSFFRIFSSYAIKDFEKIITLKPQGEFRTLDLLDNDFLKGFIKKKHKFIHMGLVQVAVKPLSRDGLDTLVIVCIRDDRHSNIKDSLLALVKANLSKSQFYFKCYQTVSASVTDATATATKPMSLYVKTIGNAVAITVKVVCKAMVDLNAEYLMKPILGHTNYFNVASGGRTEWDEVVQVFQDKEEAAGSSTNRSMVCKSDS